MPDSGIEDTILLNCAVIPPPDVRALIAQLGKQLPPDTPYVVDGVQFHPHLTLYMARFPTAALEQVVELLARTLRTQAPPRVVSTRLNVTPGRFVEVLADRTEELLGLHTAVVEALAPHRHSPGEPVHEDYFGVYDARQQAMARRYGYDLALDLYRPHITVGRLRSPKQVLSRLRGETFNFPVTDVGLFIANSDGAAVDPVARYRFDDV